MNEWLPKMAAPQCKHKVFSSCEHLNKGSSMCEVAHEYNNYRQAYNFKIHRT